MAKLKTIDAIRTSVQRIKKYVDDKLDKKQDKLTYKEYTVESCKLEFNGKQEDVLVEGTLPAYIFNLVGLVPDRYYTIKMKLYEIPEPSSLASEEELVNFFNISMDSIPMNIDVNESSFEVDYENNTLIYKLPACIYSKEDTGFSVDVVMLSTSGVDFPEPAIDFIIFDKLMFDENNMPYFLEDKSMFSLGSEYFASLIEYVEIIPEITSEDIIETEVNNEFLDTHRFITKKEIEKWNKKQDVIPDAYYLKKMPRMEMNSAIQNKADLIRYMTSGLYVATYDIYFDEATTYSETVLENGIKDIEFSIYKNDIIQLIYMGSMSHYCAMINYTTGIACVLDIDARIAYMKSTTGVYLGDIREAFQYKCLEESVTFTKEQIDNTMIGGTSYKEYQFNVDYLVEYYERFYICFEDLDGKTYEYESFSDMDGEISGKPIIKLYDENSKIVISSYEFATEGHTAILKVKVYNSAGFNDFGKITICKVEYFTTEFLETNRLVTNEEKQKYETAYNNSQITQDEFDSIVSDLFGFRKEIFVFEEYKSFDFPDGEPKDAKRIYCNIYYTDGTMEEKDMIYNKWGEGEKEYSYDLVVSPNWGTIGAYIDYIQEKQSWSIYMDYGSPEARWPEEIVKVEVIVEL